MPLVILDDGRAIRLSEVEAGRIYRARLRRDGLDDRKEQRHPNRQLSSRRTMRNIVRWRNKKSVGRFGG